MATTSSRSTRPTLSVRPAAVEPTAASQPPAPASSWQDDNEKREVMIRLAAYAFYERRGFIAGDELADWLAAEMEVDRQLAAGLKPDATN